MPGTLDVAEKLRSGQFARNGAAVHGHERLPGTPAFAVNQLGHMLFADFFLDAANRELDKRIVGFDPQAAAAMTRYDWPGNLRQMKNAVMSATLLCTGDYITCRELPAELSEAPETPAVPLRNPAGEEEQIRRALAMAGGNKSQAAKLLGIDRKTLYNKLHLYGIE